MSLLAQEPSSIGKLLDMSFKLFGASFTKIIGFGLIIGLISAGAGVFYADLFKGIENGNMDMSVFADQIPTFLAIILITMIFAFISYAAIIYRLDNVARQQDDSYGEAFFIGLRKLPAMVLAAILYTIAMSFGLVLLIIPGLILTLSLFFYIFFIVLEDQGAYQSLKSSHTLIWGDWWRTLAVFTVPGILIIIIVFAFGMLMAFVDTGGASADWVEFAMNLFSGIYMPYLYAVGYVQYHDLQLRKSGADLAARMAE